MHGLCVNANPAAICTRSHERVQHVSCKISFDVVNVVGMRRDRLDDLVDC